jgi:L-serine dehydratase
MTERSSIFDLIGPVMIGPSSSHTAGVVRIGLVAGELLGRPPQRVTVLFYNSFATTYVGHGSDRAVIGGILGYQPDDARIRQALDDAQQAGIELTFRAIGSDSREHPNTVQVELEAEGYKTSLKGVSRGGGLISIVEVDGYHANFTAQLPTLVIVADDVKGSIAFIADVVAHDDCNIATMTVSRRARNSSACLILEMDTPIHPPTLAYLNTLNWVRRVTHLPPFSSQTEAADPVE